MGDEHLRPLVPEEHLRDLGIELVALGQEDAQALDVRGGFLPGGLGLRRRRDVKGDGDGKGGPLPSRLSTRMVPFIFSTRLLTMAIPRPVP